MRTLTTLAVRCPVLVTLLVCGALLAPMPAPAPVAGAGFVRAVVGVDGAPRRLQAADLDGDGDIDLAVESVESGRSHQLVLVNGGAQAFAPGWTGSFPTGGFPGVADLDLADVDADGAPDVVLQVPGFASQLRIDAGDGTFSAPTALPVPNVGVQHALADLDGDALPDVVATRPDAGAVTVVPIRAGGPGVPTSWPAGPVPETLAVGDLDLAVADASAHAVVLLFNLQVP